MADLDHVVILERFTRTTWERKVGDGPWEKMDLSIYGGRVPVLFSNCDWAITETWEPRRNP